RMLAALGAHLVHSAPAVGVRDWSDLWIAVAAGRWLAGARPGDSLDVVSDDRAFDAVGDAAAATGVIFRRISYRALAPSAHRAAPPGRGAGRAPGRRRGGRAGAGGARAPPPPTAPACRPATGVATGATPDEEAHAASHEQIRAVLSRLSEGSARWINLDAVAN